MATFCLTWLVLLQPITADGVELLTIGGTGAALGGMQLLGDAFEAEHLGVDIRVLPSLGSSGGIRAMIDGKINVAVFARPLKKEERARGIDQVLYADTPLMIAAHRDVPAKGLTIAQISDIFAGRMDEWSDGTRMRLIMRSSDETDVELLRRLSDDISQAIDLAYERSGMLIAVNDQDNGHMLETLPGAFGFTTLAQILSERRRMKVLHLDDEEVFRKDLFPIRKRFYMGKMSSPSPLAQAFRDFVLSEAGRALLAANGHRPIAAQARGE